MLSMQSFQKIVLLGAGGFVGRHLSLILGKIDTEVHLFNRSPLDDLNLTKAHFHAFNYPDDLEKYRDQIKDADIVFFLVNTHKQTQDNPKSIEVFKKEAQKFVDFCDQAGVNKIVYTSSAAVYGNKQILPIKETDKKEPLSHYGQEKSLMEDILLQDKRSIILRITNPYGPLQGFKGGQGVIPFMFNALDKGNTVPIFGKTSTERDFIYIDDLMKVLIKAAILNPEERVFNIGSGDATKLSDLINAVEKVSQRNLKHQEEKRRPFDIISNHVDISRAQSYLDWTPEVSFNEGLKKTWDWFQNNIRS